MTELESNWNQYRELLLLLSSSSQRLQREGQLIESEAAKRNMEIDRQGEQELNSIASQRLRLQRNLDSGRASLEKINDSRFQMQAKVPIGKPTSEISSTLSKSAADLNQLEAEIEKAVSGLIQQRRNIIAAKRKADEDEARRRLDETERLRGEKVALAQQHVARQRQIRRAGTTVIVLTLIGILFIGLR